MSTPWGNDDHGPGGDQSWLGGSGPDGHEVTPGGARDGSWGGRRDDDGASSGWSSDFAADSGERGAATGQEPDVDPTDSSALQYHAPQFGTERGRTGDDDSGWSSDFSSAGGSQVTGGSQEDGIGGKPAILGTVVTILALVIFAAFAYRSGMQVWWLVFFVGIPLVRRIARQLGRGPRR